MEFRIGYGEDIHVLVAGRPLIIGGVSIPHSKGLLGHSDADVLYHAISDALLGSVAQGDIGTLFPPSDPSTEGISSSIILKKCYDIVCQQGYRLTNIDSSICAEEPHLSGYILTMRQNIASLLGIKIDDISIKAMTNEGLDAVGKKEAIKAIATILVCKENGNE